MSTVHVIGSMNMDLIAQAGKHPSVGETVIGDTFSYAVGGKGLNQAISAARLGANVFMYGCIGKDGFGMDLRDFMQCENLDISYVKDVENSTGIGLITVANGENTIVVISGANNDVKVEDVQSLNVVFHEGDYVLCQLEIPQNVVVATFKKAQLAGAITILNAAPYASCKEILKFTDILIVNETEAAMLVGNHINEQELITQVKNISGVESIILTQGPKEVLYVGSEIGAVSAKSVNVVDTTGAGDCFVGALASQLVDGVSFKEAIEFANVAASLSVQKLGAAPSLPHKKDVLENLTK